MSAILVKGKHSHIEDVREKGYICEAHPGSEDGSDYHPADYHFECTCGYHFYFCQKDGEATLRMFRHPLKCSREENVS